MSGHTAGPWAVAEKQSFPDVWPVQTTDVSEIVVADVYGSADAYLIASAPRMYETGRALLDALGFPGGRWDMDWPETPQVVAFFDAVHRLHELEP